MLFHSIQFIVFFLLLHQIFWRVADQYKKNVLIAASILFYGYWSIPFLIHFLAIIAINYFFIKLIIKTESRRILTYSIIFNITNLFLFKYANSFLYYAGYLLDLDKLVKFNQSNTIILPLAISFYTFQIIAFLVDVWRKEIRDVSLARFTLFIMFFPQLIAGPIMRHREFYMKMDFPALDFKMTKDGIFLFLTGMVKKILIGDQVGELIAPIWQNPQSYDSVSLFLAIAGFSAQIYGDFSGYTDMARGAALMLGYEIPENFLSPYLSRSFSELWKRWHITLSTWLRDYLYIPLGGNRVSELKYFSNLMIVMSLGGLWHGNTVNFFIWGFIHGLFLALERYFSRWNFRIFQPVSWLLVTLGWFAGIIFFRGADFSTSINFITSMFSNAGSKNANHNLILNGVLLCYVIQLLQYYKEKFIIFYNRYLNYIIPLFSIFLFFTIVQKQHKIQQFIYFQF